MAVEYFSKASFGQQSADFRLDAYESGVEFAQAARVYRHDPQPQAQERRCGFDLRRFGIANGIGSIAQHGNGGARRQEFTQ